MGNAWPVKNKYSVFITFFSNLYRSCLNGGGTWSSHIRGGATGISEKAARGGKNWGGGPWHQWSQKFFQISRENEKTNGKGIKTEQTAKILSQNPNGSRYL